MTALSRHTDDATTLAAAPMLSIADVARDTGIAKDTLRVWERRYGFPVPLRDAFGERRYPAEQIQRLRMIRRLMDKGLRPNKLMAASLQALEDQLNQCCGSDQSVDHAQSEACDQVLACLKQRQLAALRSTLSQSLARQGLQRFVIATLPQLLDRVGLDWLKGEIGVAEEHLLSEALQNLLRSAIHALPTDAINRPTVLLTTLPEEDHGLGLLMAEALLGSERANCLSLGLRTPLHDVADACAGHDIDIVALSISAAYAPRKALQGVLTLRQLLPEGVELWAGGAGAAAHTKRLGELPATRVIGHIGDTLEQLAAWRAISRTEP